MRAVLCDIGKESSVNFVGGMVACLACGRDPEISPVDGAPVDEMGAPAEISDDGKASSPCVDSLFLRSLRPGVVESKKK